MKINLNFLSFMFLMCLTISSCKKDVEGCTDPASDNFNKEATVNADCKYTGCTDKEAENYNAKANVSGDCVFARDKFIGSFEGQVVCPPAGVLALLNGMTTLTIDENITGPKSDVTILLKTTTGLTIPVKGVVSGNDLNLNQELKGVTLTIANNPIQADIKVSGKVTMAADKKSVSGPMNLEVTTLLTGKLNDICQLTGVKK
jgi:hypothetical protein